MKLIEFLEVANEFCDVCVKSADTLEILATYDGRNSIPIQLNSAEVINVSASDNAIIVFVQTFDLFVLIDGSGDDETLTIEDVEEYAREFAPEMDFNAFLEDALSKNGSLRTITDYCKFYC